jgi:enoyl-CoA hydratase
MFSNNKVSCILDSGIALVSINNPPVNSLDKDVMDGLRGCFKFLSQDDSVRVVIVTGEGRSFVAGGDIKEFLSWTPDVAGELTGKGQCIFNQIENFPTPVIAAINGFALGGGLELALACDIRIASEKAKIGLPEVTLGLIPGYGGTQRLCRTISIGQAKKMIFTAEIIDAVEAKQIGCVDCVVAPESLMDAAMDMAKKIAANGPVAVRGAKEAINKGRDFSMEQGLAVELSVQTMCFCSEDKIEGVDAFINKRKPIFKNM